MLNVKSSQNNPTPYHLVELSPWPMLSSVSALSMTFGGIYWWHFKNWKILLLGLTLNMLVSICWFSDMIKEKVTGFHKTVVCFGFRSGMILFILSEVLFFFSFFWAYFHKCWGPQNELGYLWPPYGFEGLIIDPFSMPLLNTVVLISSGASMTWSHHSLMSLKYDEGLMGLGMTVFLGMYFLFLQGQEYILSGYSLNSGIYGTVFFMLTGFHGFHVTIGTILLMMCLLRHVLVHFSNSQHVGFEASAWYWHFVDVVWIFLYFFVYWYGYNVMKM